MEKIDMPDEIAALHQRRGDLVSAANQLKGVVRRVNNDLHAIGLELKDITQRLKVHHGDIITDHALLRYLERVRGIDIEAVRKEILSERVMGVIRQLGSAKINLQNGCRAVVDHGVVVTVVPN